MPDDFDDDAYYEGFDDATSEARAKAEAVLRIALTNNVSSEEIIRRIFRSLGAELSADQEAQLHDREVAARQQGEVPARQFL